LKDLFYLIFEKKKMMKGIMKPAMKMNLKDELKENKVNRAEPEEAQEEEEKPPKVEELSICFLL
jgi:hypothetical protein